MKIRTIAEGALRQIAFYIINGDTSAWFMVDRIERRWQMSGFVDSLVKRHREIREDYDREQAIKRNATSLNPYLYR
jgi:hypothetical protein